MSFGGGDFGGGGGGDFSFSSWDYSSSSSDGDGDCDCECEWTRKVNSRCWCSLFLAVCCVFASIPMLCSLSQLVEHHYCVGGELLSAHEQMWCSPNDKSLVTAKCSAGCSSVRLFRLKKSELPGKVTHRSSVSENFQVGSNSYKFYSFEMNPGSVVDAEIWSSTPRDHCYFLTFPNFVLFTQQKAFSAIKSADGSLSVKNYYVNKSDAFYLVVYHPGDFSARTYFNVSLEYVLYNMTSKKQFDCHLNSECIFEDVEPNEVVIAENDGDYGSKFSLEFPATAAWSEIVAYGIVPFLFFTGGVVFLILGIVKFIKDKRRKERLRDDTWWDSDSEPEKNRGKKSKIILDEETPLASTPPSVDESTPEGNDNDNPPSYVIS